MILCWCFAGPHSYIIRYIASLRSQAAINLSQNIPTLLFLQRRQLVHKAATRNITHACFLQLLSPHNLNYDPAHRDRIHISYRLGNTGDSFPLSFFFSWAAGQQLPRTLTGRVSPRADGRWKGIAEGYHSHTAWSWSVASSRKWIERDKLATHEEP